jgi:hypothetical protein
VARGHALRSALLQNPASRRHDYQQRFPKIQGGCQNAASEHPRHFGIFDVLCGLRANQRRHATFEVASVKPAAPLNMNGGRGGRGSPGQVMFTNASMTQILNVRLWS